MCLTQNSAAVCPGSNIHRLIGRLAFPRGSRGFLAHFPSLDVRRTIEYGSICRDINIGKGRLQGWNHEREGTCASFLSHLQKRRQFANRNMAEDSTFYWTLLLPIKCSCRPTRLVDGRPILTKLIKALKFWPTPPLGHKGFGKAKSGYSR